MAELFKWQDIGCTRIALIHPLFPLKLADSRQKCVTVWNMCRSGDEDFGAGPGMDVDAGG